MLFVLRRKRTPYRAAGPKTTTRPIRSPSTTPAGKIKLRNCAFARIRFKGVEEYRKVAFGKPVEALPECFIKRIAHGVLILK